MRTYIALVSSIFSVLLLTGCPASTDLGQKCTLVHEVDGGAVPLTESQIPNNKTDSISFGTTDCDALVCVRDFGYPRSTDPNAIAYGYCSQACSPSDNNACPLSGGVDAGMTCRALLLDAQTIAAICQNDAGACQEYFANTRTPYFCAYGATPDGG